MGIDVVLVASPVTDKVAAGLPPAAVAGPGRLVNWPGGDGAADWARLRLAGAGAPEGAVAVVQGEEELDELVAGAGLPVPGEDHCWRIVVDRHDPDREREVESWLTVGNGRTGTRADSLEAPGPTSQPGLYVAGVYGWDPDEQAGPELMRGPEWTRIEAGATPARREPAHPGYAPGRALR